MGCSVFVSHKNNVTNTIFMHQDSWGQYGEATDDTPILNNFRDGLDCVNDDWILFNEPVETSKKCPMCRKNLCKLAIDKKSFIDTPFCLNHNCNGLVDIHIINV